MWWTIRDSSYSRVADGEERLLHVSNFVLDQGRGELRVGAPPANFTTGTDGRTPSLGVNVGGVWVVVATVGGGSLLRGVMTNGTTGLVISVLVYLPSVIQSLRTLALVVLVAV